MWNQRHLELQRKFNGHLQLQYVLYILISNAFLAR